MPRAKLLSHKSPHGLSDQTEYSFLLLRCFDAALVAKSGTSAGRNVYRNTYRNVHTETCKASVRWNNFGALEIFCVITNDG